MPECYIHFYRPGETVSFLYEGEKLYDRVALLTSLPTSKLNWLPQLFIILVSTSHLSATHPPLGIII